MSSDTFSIIEDSVEYQCEGGTKHLSIDYDDIVLSVDGLIVEKRYNRINEGIKGVYKIVGFDYSYVTGNPDKDDVIIYYRSYLGGDMGKFSSGVFELNLRWFLSGYDSGQYFIN